ncbi:AraC family transcriptional regulator [Promicromonospora sukumoe]|uniref:AraC-like DNA-binding protein n=1 Tax=Promicromonospora sukumoe TaxID=88382 RepID=A0A7W3PE84_9MICO|nr:AraC family transcriptional regulator [Promicromonospora sukumoe]MBA8808800.1 AraC-like DNA-binding protein [Promicromonospora sukumoe]
MDDQLSEVFDLVEVRGVVSGGFAVRGPWVSRATVEGLKFVAMVSGSARLTTDTTEDPVHLGPGEVVVLNGPTRFVATGGSGDGPPREVVPDADFSSFAAALPLSAGGPEHAVVIGGHVDLDPAGQELLRQALPRVAHVRGSGVGADNLRGSLHRLFVEVTGARMGSAFAVRQHGQLLLLEVLRAYVEQAGLPPGWLRLLADERLRPAVGLFHADPARAWGLAELSRAAAMSRTSFAERFRAVAGVPPIAYLNRWRMLLARRALRDGDTRVGALAAELGYASESAFSTAFKREVGESPLRYRARARASAAARLTTPGPTPAQAGSESVSPAPAPAPSTPAAPAGSAAAGRRPARAPRG